MFPQFGPAVLDRLYFGAGGGLDCNRKSLHRHHGDRQKNWKNRVPKHGLKGGPFFHRPSLAGGGVDYGLMSFYRFSRSASYDCEGKGDENERVFHGRIPLFDGPSLPRFAAVGCDQNHGILVSDEAFCVRLGAPRFCPLRRMAANFAKLPELLRGPPPRSDA